MASDIKLESECDEVSDDGLPNLSAKYQPRLALKAAISDWLEEFHRPRHPPKSVAVATPSLASTPTTTPITNMAPSMPVYSDLETTNLPTGTVNTPVDPSFINPTSTVLVNSLVDPLCSPEGSPIRERQDSDSESDISINPEPMDCVPSAITDSLNVLDSDTELAKNVSSDSLMQVESTVCSCAINEKSPEVPNHVISHEDLELLINFFYLPFEYTSKPLQLLQDLHWLKVNAFLIANAHKENPAQVCSCFYSSLQVSVNMFSFDKCMNISHALSFT